VIIERRLFHEARDDHLEDVDRDEATSSHATMKWIVRADWRPPTRSTQP
jgi:hypothetical protein